MAELAMYEVQYPSMVTRQKLSEADAEVFGDRAKRVGGVKKLQPVPVSRPGYADDSSDVESVAPASPDDVAEFDDEDEKSADKKAAESAKNKARTPGNKSA